MMIKGVQGVCASDGLVARVLLVLLCIATFGTAVAQEVRYIHTDALGSVAVVTDTSRNVIERREYEPYGLQLTPAVSGGPGYTGHVQDAATGLTYMQQRYYDASVGRFLSVDPVTAYSSGDMRFFTRYSYAANNPYRFTDPDGRSIWTKLVKLAINGGDVAATTAGMVSDAKTVMNPNASIGERVFAAASLASEAAPVSIGDVKDAAKGARAVVDRVNSNAEKAVREGRASRYSDATRGNSVANRETNATQGSMQANLSEAGYDTRISGGGGVQVMTNGEKSYVFRSDKPTVDFRRNGDASGKPELKIRTERPGDESNR